MSWISPIFVFFFKFVDTHILSLHKSSIQILQLKLSWLTSHLRNCEHKTTHVNLSTYNNMCVWISVCFSGWVCRWVWVCQSHHPHTYGHTHAGDNNADSGTKAFVCVQSILSSLTTPYSNIFPNLAIFCGTVTMLDHAKKHWISDIYFGAHGVSDCRVYMYRCVYNTCPCGTIPVPRVCSGTWAHVAVTTHSACVVTLHYIMVGGHQ